MTPVPAKPATSILFVCLGNICRSPLAEGVFRAVLAERGMTHIARVDSAGTGGWHAGSAPDPRSIAVAKRHGIDISGQRARKVIAQDFVEFDLLLGMDCSNVDDLRRLAGSERDRVQGFVEFATGTPSDVPDPYHGGPEGFENVYRIIREAAEALSDRLGRPASAPTSGQASSTT